MNKPTVAFVNLPASKHQGAQTPQETAFWQTQWRHRLDLERSQEVVKKYGLIPFQAPEVPFTGIYLLGFFRDAGWGIEFLELADLPFEKLDSLEVRERLVQSDASMFLLSPYTTNYVFAVRFLHLVKDLDPLAVVIVGGHHASATVHSTLEDGFDYVVTGRGEPALRAASTGGTKALQSVPGVFSSGNHPTQHPHAPSGNPHPGQLPLPAYEVLPQDYRQSYYTRLFSSHGCPYRCVFCSSKLWTGVKPWFKEVDTLSRELDNLQRHVSFEELYVGDETFTVSPEHALAVARLLCDRRIPWGAETRVNLADRDLMARLADLGCLEMDYGLESLSPEILRRIRKGITPEQAELAFCNTSECGIRTHVNLMIGLPGETPETARNTVSRVCKWIRAGYINTVDYFITVPYPGSELFEHPDRHGISLRTTEWERFREDRLPVYDLETLSAEQIYELWLEGLECFATI